jgi:hypothetical protein
MYEAIKRRNIEVHRVKPANAPDLLSFVNDIELNKYMWIFTWWKLEIKIKYSKMKSLIDGILFLWRTSYSCATEIISVAHRRRCVIEIAYFCGAPCA